MDKQPDVIISNQLLLPLLSVTRRSFRASEAPDHDSELPRPERV
jgi:hypothetical protein